MAANFSSKDGRLEHYDVYPFLVGVSHYLTASDYHVGLVELAEIEQGRDQKLPSSLQERFFDGLIVHWGLEERFSQDFPVMEHPGCVVGHGFICAHQLPGS